MRRNEQLFSMGIVMMAAVAICLATTPAVFAEMFTQTARLHASDGTTDMNYGAAAGISGNTIVIGATDTATGAAYVYTKGGSGWGSEVKLDLADWTGIDDFGNGAAIDGNTIIIGANKSTVDGVASAGTAHIYGSDGMGGWTEVALLTAGADAISDIGFGTSVAISGDIAMVGASKYDGSSGNQGACYIFGRDVGGEDSWGLIGKITASDPSSNAYFGAAVAIDGDTACIGAYNVNKTYIFEDDGAGNWSETTKNTGASSSRYGADVSIDGDTVVAGAYYRTVGATRSGWADILSRDAGGVEDSWGEVSEINTQNPSSSGYFGRGIATDGGLVVAGAFKEDIDDQTDSGAAYVFQDDGTYLEMLVSDDTAAGDGFGRIIAMSGNTIVATAPGADGFATDAGAFYVFEAVPEPSTLAMVIGLVAMALGYRRRS